jgi:hypothetical protein
MNMKLWLKRWKSGVDRYFGRMIEMDEKPTILFSLPAFEPATIWWTDCAKNVIPQYLAGKPVNIDLLIGNKAVYEEIHPRMQREEYRALGGVGHGSADKFTGQNFSIIYWTQDPDYFQELKGKCFAPVSCLVGQNLVPTMVRYGLGVGIGEITEYYVTDAPGILSFVRSDTVYWVRLAVGDTAYQAYQISLQTYEEEAKAAEEKGNIILARLLRYNAANRKFFGNPNWKLITQPPPPPPPPPPSPPSPPPPPSPGEYEVEVTIPETTLKLKVKAKQTK